VSHCCLASFLFCEMGVIKESKLDVVANTCNRALGRLRQEDLELETSLVSKKKKAHCRVVED
jgi:hypothetical protein